MLAASLGVGAALLQLVGYILYLRHFLAKSIRPNAASFLMFAYGTSLLVFLEAQNDATWHVLALPALCAAISVFVAALCFRRNATDRTDPWERVAFSADICLTIAYVWLGWQLGGAAGIAVAFLVLGNLTTVTAFLPVLRSTWQAPFRELPGPWVAWTGAYGLLAATTWVADGGANPALFIYPILSMGLHGAIATLSLRETAKVTRYFDRARTLYLQRSHIEGLGVFAGRRFDRGQPIWQLTGRLAGASYSHEHPNFIGLGRGTWIDPDQPFDLVNHSCAANAAFGPRRQLYALRAIEPGEEITFDYSTTEADPGWEMACACGEPTCRGTLHAIQIAFAEAVAPPPASPMMTAIWHKERASRQVIAPAGPALPPALLGEAAIPAPRRLLRNRRGARLGVDRLLTRMPARPASRTS